jgi:hypothetical protein
MHKAGGDVEASRMVRQKHMAFVEYAISCKRKLRPYQGAYSCFSVNELLFSNFASSITQFLVKLRCTPHCRMIH